ncbi:MAG: lectin like domain-containing protein [Clostridium sp.]
MSNNIEALPLNPEFLNRLQQVNPQNNMATQSTPPNLELPPTIILPQFINEGAQSLQTFPSSYDLRSLGRVSPVKDQGPIGSCWAFATYGSLESSLLPGELNDFSENNLINEHGFDLGPGAGGNQEMSTAYLTRWSGPIAEAEDPYTGVIHPSPSGLTPVKHVQEIRLFPNRISPTDNDRIKNALMDYGAIHASIWWDNLKYNSINYAYYNNTIGSTNHAVAIVGWDDNYPKTNFLVTPPDNGAFIIKNSWGTTFGDGGYFYISYYDVSFQARALYREAEMVSNYKSIYQYDDFGFLNSLTYFPYQNFIYMGNIFTTSNNEYLKAVGFYTIGDYTDCVIEIYKNCTGNPNSGTLVGTTNYTSTMYGYQTVDLSSPIMLLAGEKFSVLITLTVPAPNNAWIAIEERILGYSSGVTINPGESFISYDKSDWTDMNLFSSWANICIKAFTVESITKPTVYLDPPSDFITICSSSESGEFEISVSIKDFTIGQSLLGFRSVLTYDPSVLQTLSFDIPADSFLNPIITPPIINSSPGYIELNFARSSTNTTLSSGVIYKVKFKALNPGTTTINNMVADLRDGSGNPIATILESSIITIVKTTPIIPGDFNNDGVINFEDLLLFAKAYNHKKGDVGWMDYLPAEFGTPYADKDIGPATGVPPSLIITPDNIVNNIDYNVFREIWYYYNP